MAYLCKKRTLTFHLGLHPISMLHANLSNDFAPLMKNLHCDVTDEGESHWLPIHTWCVYRGTVVAYFHH